MCVMQIDEKLYAEIKQYCELNGLKIKPFISDILRKAFNREKYGDGPFQLRRENNTFIPENNPTINKKTVYYDIAIPQIEIKKDPPTSVNNVEIDDEKKINLNKTKKRKLN